jgi:hypothetical protein
MATLEVTEEQLVLIQKSLDLYSRIGILQFERILEHPTVEKLMDKKHTKDYDKPLEVGDKTNRGKIVEIGKKFIKTKGNWGDGETIREWRDVENVKRSPNYTTLHENEKLIISKLDEIEKDISDNYIHPNMSYGIYDETDVDESCRVAYDLVQVIRHEFWKKDPERSTMTVDSSVMLTTKNSDKIKVKL